MSEIARLSGATSLTAVGLAIGGELDFEEWQRVGWVLGQVRDASRFALGDWLLWGEGMYGEDCYQAVEATGQKHETLLQYARVSRQVPVSRRRPWLSWSHHQAVAAFGASEQERLLTLAEERGLSLGEFRGLVRDGPARRLASAELRKLRNEHGTLLGLARDVVNAAERRDDGHALVPLDVLDVLAAAVLSTGDAW